MIEFNKGRLLKIDGIQPGLRKDIFELKEWLCRDSRENKAKQGANGETFEVLGSLAFLYCWLSNQRWFVLHPLKLC